MTNLYPTGGQWAPPARPMHPACSAPVPGTRPVHEGLVGPGVPGATTAGLRQVPTTISVRGRRSVQLPFIQLNGAQIPQGINGLSAQVVGTAKLSAVADVEASGVPPRGKPV